MFIQIWTKFTQTYAPVTNKNYLLIREYLAGNWKFVQEQVPSRTEKINRIFVRSKDTFFYEHPKIHKFFEASPPFQSLIFGDNSCTALFYEYVGSFLQYQVKLSKSYIRDTKDISNKLGQISNLPENIYLVNMNVKSLYTNIGHK